MNDKELTENPCYCHITCHSSKGEWYFPAIFAPAQEELINEI